jgi:hypothetical protein
LSQTTNHTGGAVTGAMASSQETYETCLFDYDDEKYDNISLVPSKLRQRVYETGNAETQSILGLSVRGKSFSDLPSGMKGYISQHPVHFRQYYQTRHHEVGLMKSVLANLSPQEKRKLKEYYREQHKKVDSTTLKSILGLEQTPSVSSSSSKRSRKGGCDKGPDCTCEGGNAGDYFSDTSSMSSLTSSMASLMK